VAEADRWLWLGGSLLLGAVATRIGWWLWRSQKGQTRLSRFVHSVPFPILLQMARFLYYIGLPFAALVWGHDAVVGRLLGLKPLLALAAGPVPPADLAANWAGWARDTGWAVGLGLTAWAILAAGQWAARRTGSVPGRAAADASAWALLREAAFHEVHWAFYRNAPVVALGIYWGTWAGVGLVALEAVLNPWWRADLKDTERGPGTLVRAGLAVLSASLYLETINLWLAVLVHWGVTWGLAAWTRNLRPQELQTTSRGHRQRS